jgi:mannose-6-phosphate isomerase-like protein (cupin superfamily)
MPIRRIVTGVDADGRSQVASDGPASGSAAYAELWPGAAGARLEPEPGGSSWRVFDLPPDEVVAAYLEAQGHADAGDGFHRTDTLDYVMILDGEITLELDRGAVTLRSGDCVVQQGTRHAWRNRSGRPVKLAVVMISAARA